MSDENLDLNITNYTTKDLLKILDLYDGGDDDNLDSISKEDIIEKTNQYITKFSNENEQDMVVFFKEIQNNLINAIDDYDNSNNHENTIIPSDKLKFNRYDIRPNQIDNGENNDSPVIVPETQNIVTTFAPTEVKGTLNPLIKNTYSTCINIDSKYRQFTGINSNTNFTLDLSEPLKNLLSLQLYSYQIPFTWYIINSKMGNTCFWIEDLSTNTIVTISIDSGNYTPTSLTTELNKQIAEAGFEFDSTAPPFVYSETKGKIIFYLYGGRYQKNGTVIFTITENTKVIFFDYNFTLECISPDCGVKLPNYINQTLGWILGFRSPYINVSLNGNLPTALLDLNGPRYLILIIDDFNQNHLNNNLISITEYDNNLKLPSYYNTSLPYSCTKVSNNIDSNNIPNKLNINYTKIPNILPSAPRTLTQSQIYTINEIIKNNKNNLNYFPKAPTNSDVFAIIPIKHSNNTGNIITEISGSLQSNERIYNGPVNVSRLQISLCDDTGNTLDLNDVPWSFTMIAKCLYEL